MRVSQIQVQVYLHLFQLYYFSKMEKKKKIARLDAMKNSSDP